MCTCTGMKITAGPRPKSDHIARLAVHFSLDQSLWPDKICACACNNLIITTCKKCRVIKMATSTRKRKTAVGSSSSGASKTKQSKRQVFSKSGNGLTRKSISLRRGYVLKWTVKTSLLCLRFGLVLYIVSLSQ